MLKRIAACFAAAAILAGPVGVSAQETTGQVPPVASRPRVEVGIGGSLLHAGGTMPYMEGLFDARVGIGLTRRWSIEGLVHITPASGADVSGFYRAQAVWRIGGGAVQPFLAFGAAGEFSRWSWPEYRYNDYYTGEPRVIPAGHNFNIDPPWFPTASLGLERILASRLAIRAEVTVAFGVNDYGIATGVLPSVSVSIPIGRYRKTSSSM